MEKILVSACLLGHAVRYDGSDKQVDHRIWKNWEDAQRLVSVCPEVSGGLPIPRPAAEIVGGSGNDVLTGIARVINKADQDITQHFLEGARIALSLACSHNIKMAVFTEGSPSCGSHRIYDGSFSGEKISGEGVTIALLKQAGITIFSDDQVEAAQHYLEELEKKESGDSS